MLLPSLLVLLQDATPAAPAAGAQTPAAPAGPVQAFMQSGIPMILLIIGVFYLLLIRPERKQRKLREAMLKKLAKGDKVMTTGGLYATVAQVQDQVVTLQIADGVRARFAMSAVQTVVQDEGGEGEKPKPT